MDLVIVLLTNVLVPIAVALISSGKVANTLKRKFSSDDIIHKIDNLEYKVEKNQAETYRTRILRFNGEIKRGIHHDEEEFNDAIGAINGYEEFCKKNPNYPNNKATMAIEHIKQVYQKAYEKNDF